MHQQKEKRRTALFSPLSAVVFDTFFLFCTSQSPFLCSHLPPKASNTKKYRTAARARYFFSSFPFAAHTVGVNLGQEVDELVGQVVVVLDVQQLGMVLDVARVELALQEVGVAHDVDQKRDVLQRGDEMHMCGLRVLFFYLHAGHVREPFNWN